MQEESPQPSTGTVVLREAPKPSARWSQRLVAVRERLPELGQHPLVAATAAVTATAAGRVAVSLAKRAIAGRAVENRSLQISGVLVHHVVHHHVVHVVHVVGGSRALPP